MPLQVKLTTSFKVSYGGLVEDTLKNGISNVTSPKYLKIDALLCCLPSFQLWLFPKLPIAFIAFIIRDNGNNKFKYIIMIYISYLVMENHQVSQT